MKPIPFAAMLCVALLASVRSSAQYGGVPARAPRWLLGGVAGVTINTHTLAYPMFYGDWAPFVVPPEETSFEIGATSEYIVDGDLGVMGSLLFISRPGHSRQTLRQPIRWLDDSTGPHTMIAENDIRYALLVAELLGTWRFAKFGDAIDLGLTFGPVLGAVVDQHLHQTVDLGYERRVAQGNAPDGEEGRIYTFHDGDIPALYDFRFSLMAGLFTDIRIGDLSLMPGAYYDFGPFIVTSAGDWKLTALDLRLAMRWRM